MSEHEVKLTSETAIKAQNPDLETAWQTIAWWEQTCDYWHAEAQKGYANRARLADAEARAEAMNATLTKKVVHEVARLRVKAAEAEQYHWTIEDYSSLVDETIRRLREALRGDQ